MEDDELLVSTQHGRLICYDWRRLHLLTSRAYVRACLSVCWAEAAYIMQDYGGQTMTECYSCVGMNHMCCNDVFFCGAQELE